MGLKAQKQTRINSFKTFLEEKQYLEGRVIRKTAIAAFAAQGKRHGDAATRKWKSAQRWLKTSSSNQTENDRLDAALDKLLDGLVSLRYQLGSVSAQLSVQ